MYNSNSLKLIISVIWMFVTITLGNAQTDSSRLSYSEEFKDSSDYRFRRTYQYLDINLKNEKRLLKVSPGYNFSNGSANFQVNLGYERKIGKQFSFAVNNLLMFQSSEYDDNFYFGSIGTKFRYFPSIKKRIAQGISGNNLNGFYFEFGLDNMLVFLGYSNETISIRLPDPSFSIGIQRRLNNWSYFNIYSITYLADNSFYSYLGFNIGFAWGNK